jgi:hypothetical protein
VRGLALHPSRKYAVSVSDDASWAWWDLNNAACLKQVGHCCSCRVTLLTCGLTGAVCWVLQRQRRRQLGMVGPQQRGLPQAGGPL